MKRGKHVFATLLKKEVKIVFMISLLTLTLFVTYFAPKVAASPTAITLSSSSGHVGDSLQVSGTIDTVNGTYQILFGAEIVAIGTASSQGTVNATFSVPHSYQGNYTVTLYDINATTSASKNFTINTKYYINAIMPPQQTQLMEGQSATIRVNVTGGKENNLDYVNVTVRLPYPLNNTVYYNSSLQFTTTAHLGEYVAESIYPRDFGPSAHTNYVGAYAIASNITSVTGSLQVGLTNATQYHRFDTVTIQGANYTQPDERVWINITSGEKTVFSKNVAAIGGVVNTNWAIPWNATYGTYNVTVTNSTSPGTIKPIRDTQTFTISKITFQCQIQTQNLDNENVEGVIVAAYNKTTNEMFTYNSSDNLGIARLSLDAYTYSFEAYWSVKDVPIQVGAISALNITEDITYTLMCQLANINLLIKNEAGNLLPFITIDFKYNYTQADSDTRTFETSSTGSVTLRNTLANRSYVIEAKRYGYIFNRTSIGNLTASQHIDIICPTYTLFVHVIDSKERPLTHVLVNVTEWSSGLLVGNMVTDNWASISLNLTFGRYELKVYTNSAELDGTVILNETTVDLTEDKLFELVHCRIANLSPSVLVVDYFGQPIPNAEVKVERLSEIRQKWIEITPHQRTDSNGVALLPCVGGDYSISIYVTGQLSNIKSLYIDETGTFIFKIDKYITIAGLVVEASQLIVCIVLGLLIISLGIFLTYKKILHWITKSPSNA
jgi:hypothetical protein